MRLFAAVWLSVSVPALDMSQRQVEPERAVELPAVSHLHMDGIRGSSLHSGPSQNCK